MRYATENTVGASLKKANLDCLPPAIPTSSTTTMQAQKHRTAVRIDPSKPAEGQKGLMNRWHPDIPAFCSVKPGEVFHVECHDWVGGQIGNNDSSDDIKVRTFTDKLG